MTLLVPKNTIVPSPKAWFPELSDLLASMLECIGAAAGWIALQDGDGRLTILAQGGAFAESWLDWHQGHGSVWGVAVGSRPALLNDLRPWSKRGDLPLHNLLSCPLIHNHQILGQVALANKPHGFAVEDAAVLQGLAHHLVRLLDRRLAAPRTPLELSACWRRILDRAEEAILLLDESGKLVYVNATWLGWTGFRAEELLGRTAPFPFWITSEDLKEALPAAPLVPDALPFRRRDQSVFWCLLEMEAERWDDRIITVAFLRQTTVPSPAACDEQPRRDRTDRDEPQPLWPATPDWLPLLLDLDAGIEGWGFRWEQRTGLSARDVEGSRCNLVLDWLFPQQGDRERVADCLHHCGGAGCQLDLEIATSSGSQPALCTFLPWAAGRATNQPRRWLLLVAEPLCAATLDGAIRQSDTVV